MNERRPIGLNETLTVGSVEDFLTISESAALEELMDRFLREAHNGDARDIYDQRRLSSIHEIPGHDTAVAMATYEPSGRVEITDIPDDAETLLQAAFTRVRARLERILPSVTSCRPWTYVEYGPGQHITPHLDGIAPDPRAWPRQIAGISVIIGTRCEGGEFFVETTSSASLWKPAIPSPVPGYEPAMAFAHDGADNSSPWFAAMPRTRWCTAPAPGTALLYGSQLVHGTTPVRTGRSRKFISWLFADQH
ncbi:MULTISPECIES: 2OG-Fe(II) oxygenase [Nocardia]|uniref:2OG-Fe(II) oxygenase n=1 Tax=Nocardia TaxID=1817 RepID=UPI0019158A9E|nr:MULTISPECIES: 2OG-Fe(II) oxygenase [Nocardia]